MHEFYIHCDEDWAEPEVQISGPAKSLAELGKLLKSIQSTISWNTTVVTNDFYTICIHNLLIKIRENGNDRITVEISPNNLGLIGSKIALEKLGDSLTNFFDGASKVGEHFQLDYYESNDILNKTSCHLIFICDR